VLRHSASPVYHDGTLGPPIDSAGARGPSTIETHPVAFSIKSLKQRPARATYAGQVCTLEQNEKVCTINLISPMHTSSTVH
jgi:hypothetical protein